MSYDLNYPSPILNYEHFDSIFSNEGLTYENNINTNEEYNDFFSSQISDDYLNNSLKNTADKTNKAKDNNLNLIIVSENVQNEENKIISNVEKEFNNINKIKKEYENYISISDKLKEGKITKSIEENFIKKFNNRNGNNEKKDLKFTEKKRQRQNQEVSEILINGPKKMGRKSKDETGERKHNKYSEDNLIYSCQTNFYNWTLDAFNTIIKKKGFDIKLLQLDNKILKNINKEDNLKTLEMPISKFLSQDISPKYYKYKKDKFNLKENEINIKKLLDGNDGYIKTILEKPLQYFFNIYRHKIDNNIINEFIKDINNSENSLNNFLTKIYNEEKDEEIAKDYVSSILIMIYNYESWFELKKSRKKRNKAKME